jgi:hypothetical protein
MWNTNSEQLGDIYEQNALISSGNQGGERKADLVPVNLPGLDSPVMVPSEIATDPTRLREYIRKNKIILTQTGLSKNPYYFDIDKAINWLNNNAHSSYKDAKGECASFIVWALQEGGATSKLYKIPAKDDGPYLKDVGFTTIKNENYTAKSGDIVFMQSCTGHPNGHIQMWNGVEWVSDFKQGNLAGGGFWPAEGYIKEKPSYIIYRLPW